MLLALYNFILILFSTAFFTGILGGLTGLGGGVILIPFLVIGLKINIYYAMGAALMCVIATSQGALLANLNNNLINLRIGIFLSTSAVIGALVGASLLLTLNQHIIEIIFGIVLLISAILTWRNKEETMNKIKSHPWAKKLSLEQKHPFIKNQKYKVKRVPQAFGILFIGGILSSLLGIGSGSLNILAMNVTMRIPYHIATVTSNFMIGILASVSAAIYLSRGFVDPILTFPLVIGILAGSFIGSKILVKSNLKILRIIVSILIILLGFEMIFKGIFNI